MKKWEEVKRGMYKKDPGMKKRVEKEKEKLAVALDAELVVGLRKTA